MPRVFPRLCLGFFLACASDVVPNGFYVCGFYVPRIVAFQVRGCESSLTLWLPCVASKCLLMWLLIVVSIMVSSSAAANVASKDGFYVGFHSAPSNMAFHSGFSL